MTTPARNRGPLGRLAPDFARSERGATSTMMTLALLPICGAVAMAAEVGYWTMSNRNMQHAADSAALAAAASGDATLDGGVERYKREASAVAATYKLGANATVTTVKADCPGSAAGDNDCYKVTIGRAVPFTFARLAGYTGVAAPGGGRGAQVTAVSYAKQKVIAEEYCAIALGTDGITLEGSSSGWNTCNARSNGEVKCTASDFKMVYSPSQKTCDGYEQDTTTYADPITGVADKIPSKSDVPCSASLTAPPTVINGTSFVRVCTAAAAKLTGDVTISADNSAIIFDNVSLNTNGDFTLTVDNGTLIYTNSDGTNIPGWTTNDRGGVKVTAPTSGTFANLAIADNPSIATATPYGAANHLPDFSLMGIMYGPKRDVTFKGPVYSTLGSYTCIAFITKSLDSNGGKIPNDITGSCDDLGYVLPGTPGIRQALVQ